MNALRLRIARLRSRHARTMRVECAWCTAVISEGDPALPVSHGQCPRCAAEFDAEDREEIRKHIAHMRPTGNDSGRRGASPSPALGGPLGHGSDDSCVSMSDESAASGVRIQRTHGGKP